MKQKHSRLSVRVPEEMKRELDRVARETRIDQADLVRACVEALIDYIDENGEITMPLKIEPKSKDRENRISDATYPAHKPQYSTAEEAPAPNKFSPKKSKN